MRALVAAVGLWMMARAPLTPPVEGMTLADLHDTFNESRDGHRHEAVDIMAPRGTRVRAAVSGTIQKLFVSKNGGITIYEFDEAGARCYYYAHLDRYADGVHEGSRVKAGDVIAYVGYSGNANAKAPHLHFAVSELGPKREWWKGTAINPYADLREALMTR